MKFNGICLISERVPALVTFYEEVFSRKAAGDYVHAEFTFGEMGLAIFTREGMEQMAPGSMRGAGYGACTLAFEVEDVDAEYERLKALGVDFVKLPATHPWGSRSFWFRDPDGNIIDFFSPVSPIG